MNDDDDDFTADLAAAHRAARAQVLGIEATPRRASLTDSDDCEEELAEARRVARKAVKGGPIDARGDRFCDRLVSRYMNDGHDVPDATATGAPFPASMNEGARRMYGEMLAVDPDGAAWWLAKHRLDPLASKVVAAVNADRARDAAASVRYATPSERLRFASGTKTRALGSAFTGIDRATRTATFIASTDAVDSYGEIVDQASWQLDRYRSNPVVLYAHDSRALPIGVSERVAVESGRLVSRIRFASSSANPRAEEVWNCVCEGVIRAVSVGFKPNTVRMERRGGEDIVVLADNELFEISVTPIPANPEALGY